MIEYYTTNINNKNIETLDILNIDLDNLRSYYYKIYDFNSDYEINDILLCNHQVIYEPKIGFRYFCYRYLDIIKTFKIPNIKSKNKYETVLIEYRKMPHLEFLVRNMIQKLDNKYWSFSVVCGVNNYQYIFNICQNISKNINVIKTEYHNLNQSTYSELLSSEYFWNLLHGEKILIYQEDSCIFKSNIMDFIEYDYVGAPWPVEQDDNSYGVGNGGFSLRSRKIMLDIIKLKSINNVDYNKSTNEYIKNNKLSVPPEDVYFTKMMIDYDIGRLAPFEIAKDFSVEQIYNSNSFGGHAFWLAYQNMKWINVFENTFFKIFKTLAITTPYDFSLGGGEYYLSNIIKYFLQKNFVIIIFNNTPKKIMYNTFKIYFSTEYFPKLLIKDWNDINLYEKQFDYHIDMLNSKIPEFNGLAKEKKNNYFHCQFPFDLDKKYDNNRITKLSTYSNVIVNSEFTHIKYKKYTENLDYVPKINILYPPSIVESDCTYNINDKIENSFVILGRIFEYNEDANNKNIDIAIKSLTRLDTNNWSLSIIGSVKSQEWLKYLQSLSNDNITFHLDVSDEEKNIILKKSKYYLHLTGINDNEDIHPHRFEHFGISLIEALKYACVPICVNGGYHKHIINNDKNGILVNNIKELYISINKLVNNKYKINQQKVITINYELIKKYTYEQFYINISKLITLD